MRLVILGSGTAIPRERRGASGYAVVADDGSACVLECGPGSTRRWPHAGVSLEAARLVLCTHHHIDHCGELPGLLFARNVVEPPASAPLCLAGPIGHAAHLEGLARVHGSMIADEGGGLTVRELADGETLRVPPFTVEARVVRHTPGALGVRVHVGERTLAFSGDTGPCDAVVDLCRDVDVALLECSFSAHRPTESHLTTTECGEIARAASVEHLVLTHFYPDADAADREAEVRAGGYRGRLFLAEDLDVYDVGDRIERTPGPWEARGRP
ncbi:MAG: MBL fold metallo-hydrolase [Sandaracinaceae bacterium]